MNELIVNGSNAEAFSAENEQFENHVLTQVIHVHQNRGMNPASIPYGENDVVEVLFEDGTSWITAASKLQEAFEKSSRDVQVAEYVIPQSISVSTKDRGLFKIMVKTVKFFKSKLSNAIEAPAKRILGIKLDERLMPNEGLFAINQDWSLKSFEEEDSRKHYLLFIHGFISNFESAFSDIYKIPKDQKKRIKYEFEREIEEARDTILGTMIKLKYKSNLLAFNHRTISKSPIQNTQELLEQLPDGCTVDIIAHSRGGLIADLLSICDQDNEEGITEKDITRFPSDQREDIHNLKKLAESKNIKVNKVMRAGSPMNGTYLLSENLDDFLSSFFALIELSTKGAATVNPYYNAIKNFIVSVVGSKADADIFPGVAAMVPGSPLLQMLNDNSRNLSNPLFTIEGNAEIGRNILHSLGVILGNILHRRANDFIVNTSSMRFGSLRKDGAFVCSTEDSDTTHFNYFKHSSSSNALYEAIIADKIVDEFIPGYTYYPKEELIAQFEEKSRKSRGGESVEVTGDLYLERSEESGLLDMLYGKENDMDKDSYSNTINIKLVHGNLRFASYPVLAGHFKDQAIVSAEIAIDKSLNYQLSDHHLLGKYPSEPKDNIVIYNDEEYFKGCILVGLGEAIDFNELKLRKAVENGVISYALNMRDGHQEVSHTMKGSISSLCIGSGFGGLNIDACLTAILFGVNNANKRIFEFNKRQIERSRFESLDDQSYLVPISNVEIIEIYEHKVREAFYGLKRIKDLNFKLNIEIPEKITAIHGRLKELNTDKTKSYWYDLISRKEETIQGNAQISFLSHKGGAKVDESVDFYSIELVSELLKAYSKSSNFDKKLSNSLFQLLVPRRLRPLLRGEHNIVWKMDKSIARIPWEMIHDQDSDVDPTFVNSGLVRQMITSRVMPSENINRDLNALIIGDPIYTKYEQLPGAKAEAELVDKKFENLNYWSSIPKIGKGYVENSMALLNLKYKVLHICGHGVYDPKTQRAGLVMEDKLLDTVLFNNLENIPEFAFINCCYSGTTDESFEELHANRFHISASIGTQLIEMGVKAVIVTGWAVNDATALAFAEKFYNQFLSGINFGTASKNARRHIYENFDNKTWGAYQCYGDPWYELVERSASKSKNPSFNTQEEALVALFNIENKLFSKDKIQKLFDKTTKIHRYIKDKWPNDTSLFENIAAIYFKMDYNQEGQELTEEIFRMSDAEYSVRLIEQYVYSQLKNIQPYHYKSRLSDKENKKAEEEFKAKTKKAIRSANEKLGLLFKISETSHRLCYRGLLKMREAVVSEGVEFDNRLKDMKIDFLNAYEILRFKGPKKAVFPFMMFAFANYNEDENRQKKVTYKDKSYDLKDLLDKLMEEVLAAPSKKNNFWSDIAPINIKTCKIILANQSENQLIDSLKEEILSQYKEEFKLSGTYRNLRAEIDQFEFLTFLINRILDRKKESKSFSKSAERSLNHKLTALTQILTELLKLKSSIN